MIQKLTTLFNGERDPQGHGSNLIRVIVSLKKKLRHFSLFLGPSKQLSILFISLNKKFQPESNYLAIFGSRSG